MSGQRLLNKEIDKRVIIKLDKSIRKTNDGVNGLMIFGKQNDYPQIIEKLINGSVTAKAVSNIYSRFLIGHGFENEQINDIVVGHDSRGKKITILSLLRQVAISVAFNNGYYIHCNINVKGIIGSVHLKSFKNIRFSKPDDTGYTAKLLYSENWAKDPDLKKYNQKDIIEYNVFNLGETVLSSEIEKAKGIKNYKGQIYFQFIDDTYFYPLSIFDSAYLDMDTEAKIGLFKNRQIRDGFFDTILMRVAPAGTDEEREEFVQGIKRQLGPDGERVVMLEDDVDEDGNIEENGAFKVDKIENNINDKLFENWETSLANNIRKAANGIPAVLIDYEENKLGTTSGEAIIQATNYYNSLTADDRALIEDSFQEIFTNFNNETLRNNTNWKIKPLNLIEQEQDGITDTNTTTEL